MAENYRDEKCAKYMQTLKLYDSVAHTQWIVGYMCMWSGVIYLSHLLHLILRVSVQYVPWLKILQRSKNIKQNYNI